MNYIIICILAMVLMLLIVSLALSNFELVMFISEKYHNFIDKMKKKKKRTKLMNVLPFINTYEAFNNFYDLRRYVLYCVSIMKKDGTIIENCELYLNDNQVYIYKDYFNNRIDNNDIIYISFNTKEIYDNIKNNIEFFINVNIP